MKFTQHLYLILSIISLLMLACRRENDVKPVPPRTPQIQTDSVKVHSDGGVDLYGSVSEYDQVQKIGFAYALDTVTIWRFRYIQLGAPAANGSFHASIDMGLEKDSIYYFRAFMVADSVLTWGTTKSFISNGSKPVRLDSLSALRAHLGDTLRLYGKYLSDSYIRVGTQIGNKVRTEGDSIIYFTVPRSLKTPNATVYIQNAYSVDSIAGFKLYEPVITHITPTFTFGDTIMLQGDHFDTELGGNRITSNQDAFSVVAASRTVLKAIVPPTLQRSRGKLTLTAQIQSVVGPDSFHLKQPEITMIPEGSETTSEITIAGRHFNPQGLYTKVYFEGIEATVLSGNATSIRVRVPVGPYPNASAKVKVTVIDMQDTHQQSLRITDKWIMRANLPFSSHHSPGAFVIDDVAYVMTTADTRTGYIWRFNEDTYTWARFDIPSEIVPFLSSVTSNGQKAYFCSGEYYGKSFWEYTPGTNTWKRLADFPGTARSRTTHFVLENKIYFGMGVSSILGTNTYHRDLYEYDINTDAWKPIAAPPEGYPSYGLSFTLNNIAYLYAQRYFWRYNQASDSWTRMADPAVGDAAMGHSSTFVRKGKGYMLYSGGINGHSVTFWAEYNPTTNTWRRGDNIGYVYREAWPFSFTVKGRTFVGGGGENNIMEWVTE